jgi:hypothetical protein
MAIVEPVKPPRTTDPKEIEKFFKEIAQRFSYLTYAGNPTGNLTPRWTGDNCLDTTNTEWYRSTGPLAADWEITT